jgi:hypothetical protein
VDPEFHVSSLLSPCATTAARCWNCFRAIATLTTASR